MTRRLAAFHSANALQVSRSLAVLASPHETGPRCCDRVRGHNARVDGVSRGSHIVPDLLRCNSSMEKLRGLGEIASRLGAAGSQSVALAPGCHHARAAATRELTSAPVNSVPSLAISSHTEPRR